MAMHLKLVVNNPPPIVKETDELWDALMAIVDDSAGIIFLAEDPVSAADIVKGILGLTNE